MSKRRMKGKVSVLACSAAAALCVNAEFKKPAEAKLVPGLMVTAAGEKVDGVEKWEKIRRGEILRTFSEEFYGVRPVERPADLRFTEIAPVEECFGGKALRKRVKGTYSGPGGSSEFVFSVWIPKCDRPVAVFVHSSPRPAETAADVNGPRPVYWLPAEDIVSRGYAVVAYCNQEIALDWHMTDVATNGVFKVFGNAKLKERRPTEWGILSAWAWGMSRIVDWIETEPLLDPKRIAGVGLSRNGKTSLVAGATDDRFAMVVSCCSGCGGAKLNHMVCDQSETIGDLARAVNWFAPNFLKYVGKDRGAEMKFDQHLLLALVAPRLLYVSSAVEDAWAGPRGEFAAAALASPAWELYGKAGLVHHGFPKADYPLHAGNIGYHLRTGLHDITRYDWSLYMDFADGHGWNLPRRGASKRPAVPAAQTSVTVSKGLPLSVVQKADAYNCWPMFGRIGRRLVCSYSRGAGHTIEGGRGAYVRFSDDGGDGWSAETRIADDPTVCEMAEGVGLDDDGAMLMWMYCNGGGRIWHELLRTRDGVQYEKTAKLKLSPVPTQVMDIVQVPGVGLMSTWFAGDYRKAESGHSWGTLVSADNGRTWVQRTVESDLPRGDWPTEISLAAVGGGRLIAIGRSERTVRRQFQLTSRDGGRTWKKSRTNIRDVNESTPALVYDGRTGLLSNYYYQRGPGILWRRTVRLDDIFDSPESWPEPVEVARGGRDRPYDSGNVKAVADGSVHRLVFYSGNPTNTEVVMVTVPADPFGRK